MALNPNDLTAAVPTPTPTPTPKPSVKVDPKATALANYIDNTHKAGYGDLDPNILVATSTGATGHPTHNSILDTIKNAAGGVLSGIENAPFKAVDTVVNKVTHFFSDPSIQVPANLAQKTSDHFNNTGIQTYKPKELQIIQNNLQKRGFGKNLKANGVWDSDWANEAYNLKIENLNKQSVGTFSSRKTFDTIFGPSFLSHAIPLVASMAKSAIGEAVHAASLIPKLTAETQKALPWGVGKEDTTPTPFDKLGHAIDAASRLIEQQKAQTLDEYIATPLGWKDALAVADTALTVSVLGRGLKEGALAIKGAVTAGKEAGATNVVTAFGKDLGKAAAERPNKWVVNSLFPESQAGLRRLPFTNSLLNSPTTSFANTLGHVGESIATGGTKAWKAARTVAAQPYRLPIVGAIGKIGVETSMMGLKLGLIANSQKFLGDPDGAYAQTLDHLTPIAGLEGTALNLLQLGLHAPHYDINGFASHEVGTQVENARVTLQDALQQNSVRADWARGTQTNLTKLYKAAASRGISSDIVDYGILNNYHEFAARFAAEAKYQELVRTGKIDPTQSDLRISFLEQTSHAIRNNPDLMNQAVEAYKLTPGLFGADLARSMANFKADKTYDYRTSFLDKLERDKVMREQIVPYLKHAITPETLDKNSLNPEAGPVPYGYSSYVDTIQKAYEDAQQKEAMAHNAAADLGLVKKGVVQRISPKSLAKATDPAAKARIKEQLAAQEQWDAATKTRAAIARKLEKANRKTVVKTQYPITDAMAAALNDQTLIPSFGHMNVLRQTSGDIQGKAMKFYNELEKAKPGFKAPTKVEMRTDVQSARTTNLEDINPWEVPPLNQQAVTRNMPKKLPRNYDPATASSAELALRDKVLGYLGSELNVNIKDLLYVPTENLIDLVKQRASKAAGDVTIPLDAPQALYDGIANLNALGGKLVYGTDIGHAFNYMPQDIANLGDTQSRISYYADKLGLNFSKADPSASAKHAYSTMLDHVQDHLNNVPTGTYPAWATAPRMMNYINSIIKPKMNWAVSAQYNITATKFAKVLGVKGFSKQIKALMEEDPTLTKADAKTALQNILTPNSGPQYWMRKDVIAALTKTSNQDNGLIKVSLNGKEIEVEPITINGKPLSKKQASDFYDAMRKGLGSTANYVGGLNPFVKLLDNSLYLGKLPIGVKGHQVLDLLPGIKNQIMAFRYQGSPRFAYLRVLKSAIKGVTEDVPFSMNPMHSLKASGNYDKAMRIRDMYLGADKKAQEVSDYVNAEFDRADVYNVYNPQATEAWVLWNLHKNALEAVANGEKNIVKHIPASSVDYTPSEINMLKDYAERSVLYTKQFKMGEENSKALDAVLSKSTINSGTYYRALTPQDIKELGNAKPGQIWNTDIQKSITKNIDTVTDIAKNKLRVANESSGIIAKIVIDKPVKGIEDLNVITPMVKREGEGILGSTKLVLKEINHDSVNNTNEYVFELPKTNKLKPEDQIDRQAILKKFNDIYSYGNRTAAEKSVNAFFFPFSFEKTIVRQLGGHLLDSPTSRLITAQAISMYDTHEQDIKDWYKKHGPVIKEFEKFNTFYHGIGVGVPGGILAGTASITKQFFVHLMQPHAVTDMASAKATVAMIPVLNDLNNIIFGLSTTGNKPSGPQYAELAQSINGLRAWASDIHGKKTGTWQPNNLMPYDAQQSGAWGLRQKLLVKAAGVLMANRHGGTYTWPESIPAVGGLKVSSQTLNDLIHHVYPEWNPAKIQEWVATQAVAISDQRAAMQKDAPHTLSLYDNFIKGADQIRTVISKDVVDPAALSDATSKMRAAALKLSYSDKTFYTFYKKYYESKFGPLGEL